MNEVCSECAQFFPRDEMIQHGNAWVCAGCKPVFLQKLQEGVGVSRSMRYAGFWIRVGAKLIDGIIMFGVSLITNMAVSAVMIVSNDPVTALLATLVSLMINIAFGVAYTTFFVGRFGATPGKMACGLRIVMPDGGKVSYLRAFARYFAEIVSGIVLYIGYIMVAFDDECRSLHDRICDTRVIYN
jgi:uncharacterized RDD family membrane protein YckC